MTDGWEGEYLGASCQPPTNASSTPTAHGAYTYAAAAPTVVVPFKGAAAGRKMMGCWEGGLGGVVGVVVVSMLLVVVGQGV